jgi:hypothetical protein
MPDQSDFQPDVIEDPEIKDYSVTVELKFAVRATSLPKAYREFEELMLRLFSEAYTNIDEGEQPKIIPQWYEGMTVERVRKDV